MLSSVMSMSKNSTSAAGNSSGYLPYFDYHGIEPGAYYGIPYRQVSHRLEILLIGHVYTFIKYCASNTNIVKKIHKPKCVAK